MYELYVTLFFIDSTSDFSIDIPAYFCDEIIDKYYLEKGAFCVKKIFYEKLIDCSLYTF